MSKKTVANSRTLENPYSTMETLFKYISDISPPPSIVACRIDPLSEAQISSAQPKRLPRRNLNLRIKKPPLGVWKLLMWRNQEVMRGKTKYCDESYIA